MFCGENLELANSVSTMSLIWFCIWCWGDMWCRLAMGARMILGWYWHSFWKWNWFGTGTGPGIAGAVGVVVRVVVGWVSLEAPRHASFFLFRKQKRMRMAKIPRVAVPERAKCRSWIPSTLISPC